ncbi:hypothetical protein BDV18DRAFT_155924 [Aspergillus unguis]
MSASQQGSQHRTKTLSRKSDMDAPKTVVPEKRPADDNLPEMRTIRYKSAEVAINANNHNQGVANQQDNREGLANNGGEQHKKNDDTENDTDVDREAANVKVHSGNAGHATNATPKTSAAGKFVNHQVGNHGPTPSQPGPQATGQPTAVQQRISGGQAQLPSQGPVHRQGTENPTPNPSNEHKIGTYANPITLTASPDDQGKSSQIPGSSQQHDSPNPNAWEVNHPDHLFWRKLRRWCSEPLRRDIPRLGSQNSNRRDLEVTGPIREIEYFLEATLSEHDALRGTLALKVVDIMNLLVRINAVEFHARGLASIIQRYWALSPDHSIFIGELFGAFERSRGIVRQHQAARNPPATGHQNQNQAPRRS